MNVYHKIQKRLLPLLLVACLMFTGCSSTAIHTTEGQSNVQKNSVKTNEIKNAKGIQEDSTNENASSFSLSNIPPFSDSPYVVINDNIPDFSEKDMTTTSFEKYSDLDSLGRCGAGYANVGQDIMPTEKRGSISSVKPTGWHSTKYDCVDGKYLYNRAHIIGFQLTGENANKENLITGTRYMNVEGMLPFENMVADYVKETNNHVLYRVTPIYDGDNLVANGVQMEAKSVEDDGEGVLFNVYVYNNQPGVMIDYATGESCLDNRTQQQSIEETYQTYILNTDSKKFHTPSCSSASSLKSSNRKEYTGSRDNLISQGYEACGKCKP